MGQPDIGHAVIRPIEQVVLEAQVGKRKFNIEEYDKRVLLEFMKEQPFLFGILEHYIFESAKEYADLHEIRGTEAWDNCIDFWTERFLFIISFHYKCMSVGIESQIMNQDIKL